MSASTTIGPPAAGRLSPLLRRVFRGHGAWVGAILVGGFALAGAAEPWINQSLLGRDCQDMPKDAVLVQPPSRKHPLGTDHQGRDQLTRILCGSRTSLVIGVSAEAIALTLGVLLGGCAGFLGGRVDAMLMRFTDMVLAFPFPLVAIAVVALTDTGHGSVLTILLLLGLLGWPGIARLVRARVLSLRNAQFVDAARAGGAGNLRVLIHHALPAGMAPAWAVATVGVGSNILAEAWLSFIGLGASNTISWGSILDDARLYAGTAWWYPLFPGLAITLTILGFLLLGDALRDALDPHPTAELP